MSDGDAPFPKSGIKNFVENKSIINKIKIYTVPFGKNANKSIL